MSDQPVKIGNRTLYSGLYEVVRRNNNRPDTILGLLVMRYNGPMLEWELMLKGGVEHNSDFHPNELVDELESILGVNISDLGFKFL
jgi:hypothetical protein